jgi:restriction system protein
MGYGGSRVDASQAIGKSGDEGLDGIIKEDRLGVDIIYVQAKRWAATVGRPEITIFLSRFRFNCPSQRPARLTLSKIQKYQEIAARSVGIARMQATTSYPKNSMTNRLNFSGFSMNIEC